MPRHQKQGKTGRYAKETPLGSRNRGIPVKSPDSAFTARCSRSK
jgi:hypothetical protein